MHWLDPGSTLSDVRFLQTVSVLAICYQEEISDPSSKDMESSTAAPFLTRLPDDFGFFPFHLAQLVCFTERGFTSTPMDSVSQKSDDRSTGVAYLTNSMRLSC